MMEANGEHLPTYGPGPLYVVGILALTAAGIALSAAGVLPVARLAPLTVSLRILGVPLGVGGVALWVAAVKFADIDHGIETNRLVTGGVYAIVRNPIYSAFAMVLSGVLMVYGNLWLLVLLPVFWILMTAVVRLTEERWLYDLYGEEYAAYCARVNRCIPWFSRRGRA